MQLRSFFQRTVVIFLLICGSVFAEPEILLSSVSSENIKAKLSELERLKNSNLDTESKEMLNSLWLKASKIAALNDQCAEISLTEEINDECYHFYKVELPQFEDEYFELTGEIRLNGIRLSRSMDDRRNAIEACNDAFPLHSLEVRKIISLEGEASPEPLSQGVEVEYTFSFSLNEEYVDRLRTQLKHWFSVCNESISKTNSPREFAPLFKEKLTQNQYEHITLSPSERGKKIYIKQKNTLYANYKLNGKSLFYYTIAENETIGSIEFDNYHNQVWLRFDYPNYSSHWNGKEIYTDKQTEKGLYGRLEWKEQPSLSTSSKGHSQEKPKEPDPGFKFQVHTSLLVGIPSNVKDKFKEDYSNVEWNDVTEDSLTTGTWVLSAMAKYYGNFFSLGVGAGLGVQWFLTSESTDTYYYSDATEGVNLGTICSPLLQAEAGFLRWTGFEIGARFTYFMNSKSSYYLGGYAEIFDFLGLEVGYFDFTNRLNGVYVGITFTLPTYTL